METIAISAQTRETRGRKTKKVRKEGLIPGVVYGHKKENRIIEVNGKEFKKAFLKAGESTLINLSVDDKNLGKVVISDYQTDPVSDNIIHFDLYQVKMDEKIITNVPVKFIGESPAVKNEGGILIKSHDVFEIKCLPGDLIHNIEVNLSKLEHIDDIIRVKDLKISDKIEIVSSPEVTVITVAPPRTEKEIADLEEKVEENIEDVEGAEEEKTEENSIEDEKKEKKTDK